MQNPIYTEVTSCRDCCKNFKEFIEVREGIEVKAKCFAY